MSCVSPHSPSDLRQALAHRFDADATEPATWPELRDHLAACEGCRRQALAVDPTLLFDLPRRRPGAPEPVAQVDPREMISAVAAMRRAERVESRSEELAIPAGRGWTRYAAAAAVSVAALSYAVGGHVGPMAAPPAPAIETAHSAPVYGDVRGRAFAPAEVPLVERTESDAELLYEVSETDVDVAFFAIEDFDV